MKTPRLLIALLTALLLAAPLTLSAAPDGGSTPLVTEPTAAAPTTPAPADAPKADPKDAPASVTPVVASTTQDKTEDVIKATDSEKQSWWQVLLAELLNLFLVIFVPVLSTLVVTLLKRWKINVEFEQVNSIAVKAAGWAEQMALTALKEGKEKTSGGDKMKLALDFANGLANQYKLSSKATTKLQELIESSLGQEKMKAAAAAEATAPKPEATEPA